MHNHKNYSTYTSLPFSLYGFLIYSLFVLGACNSDGVDDLPTSENREVWTGSTFIFEKTEGSDPNSMANQDRITDNVWITRNNDGGQIFNIKVEAESTKQDSPIGTLWAVGTIDEIDNLNFQKFRATVDKPKDVVGKALVAYLIDDDVYLSVKFTKWSDGKAGGFAYERSSK